MKNRSHPDLLGQDPTPNPKSELMKQNRTRQRRLLAPLALIGLLAVPYAQADDGTWTANANGNWSDPGNWDGGTIADGAGFTATLDDVISGNRTITNDGRTIGNITAADTSHNFTISSNTLTLDVIAGSPTLSVPSGRTLTISSTVAGTEGFTKTGDGTLTLSSTGNTVEGDVTVSGGLVNWAQGGARTFSSLSGSGDFYRTSQNGTLTIEDASAFQGDLATFNGGNSTHTIEFQTMGDAGGNLITRGGTGDSNQRTRFRLYGDVGPVTFNNRAVKILSKRSTPNNWSGRGTRLDNDNSDPANAWVINTDLINETDRNHELEFWGNNTGDNTFAGIISDSTGIGGLGAFYSTQTGELKVIKSEGGKWILAGVNTYTGSTSVTGGTLVIGGAGQLGSGSYGGSISINAGTELVVDSSAANTFTGPISGTGELTQDGTGVLTLGDGTNNASLGDFSTFSVSTGSTVNLDYAVGDIDTVLILNLDGSPAAAGVWGATGSGAPNESPLLTGTGRINNLAGDTTSLGIAFYDGGNSDLAGPGNAASDQTNGGTWDDSSTKNWDIGFVDRDVWFNTLTSEGVFAGSIGKTVTLGSDVNVGTMTMNTRNYTFSSGSNTITFGPTGVINANTDNNRTRLTRFNCNVAGGDITLNGTGWVRIDGTASFNSFTMNGSGGVGELGAGTYNGFGPGVLTINSGNFFSTNGSQTTIPNNMVWNGNFTVQNVSISSKVMEFDGNVTLGNNVTVSAKHQVFLDGVISDGGNNYQIRIQDNGGGANFHFNNANTFGGGVWWSEDNITINNAAGLGTGTLRIDGALGTMDNKSGGAITLSTNNAVTLDDNFAFAGTNDLNLGTGPVTLTNSRTVTVNAGTLTFGGSVGQSGTRNLTKAGAGTLELSGANTYSGNTSVNAGTLSLVGGSQNSAITVGASGSLGFTLGSTTSSTKSVNLTNGTVKITGAVDNVSDYQLMTTSSTFTTTGTLDSPIADYQLELRNSGTELWLAFTGSGGGGSAFDTWAVSNGVAPGSEAVDSDSGGQNNLYEFGLGGTPTDGNDDGALLNAYSSDVVAGGDPEGVLTILVRDAAAAGFSASGNDQVSTADGITYTVSAENTLPVASAATVTVSGTTVTDGLPAAPAGYTYVSFYITGAEGYFQVTVEPAP